MSPILFASSTAKHTQYSQTKTTIFPAIFRGSRRGRRREGKETAPLIKSYNSGGQTSGQSYSLITSESSLRGCPNGAFRSSHYCYLIVPPSVRWGRSAPSLVGGEGKAPRLEKGAGVVSAWRMRDMAGWRSFIRSFIQCCFFFFFFFLFLCRLF